MSNRSSLQQLAYRAIPHNTYHRVKTSPSKEKERAVLEHTQKYVTKYKQFSEWKKTVKKPSKYIQELLVLLNYYTKPDYYNAYNRVRKINRNYTLHNTSDYFSEISETLEDKVLHNPRISEHKTEEIWDNLKWPHILQRTFFCLCYKRLRHISDITEDTIYWDSEYDKYMNKDLFEAIKKMKDSDNLPLIIYMMIETHSKRYRTPVA